VRVRARWLCLLGQPGDRRQREDRVLVAAGEDLVGDDGALLDVVGERGARAEGGWRRPWTTMRRVQGVYREFVRKTGISPADVAVPVAWKARRDNPRAAPFRRKRQSVRLSPSWITPRNPSHGQVLAGGRSRDPRRVRIRR
jgi:hypothetical protein